MAYKKLLIVTSTFPKNDKDSVTARFVFDLAGALTSFYEVYVLCPHSKGLPLCERINNLTIYRFRYFMPEGLELIGSGKGISSDLKNNALAILQIPLFLFAQYVGIIKIVKKHKIDIVNSHWIVPQGFICSLVKKVLKFQHVVTVHAADIFALKRLNLLGTCLAKFILNNTDLVLPVSSYIKEQVFTVAPMAKVRHKIIPMGVNLSYFNRNKRGNVYNKKNGQLSLFFVGKMVEKKGLKYLLEALSILKQEGVNFRLRIAGGGRLENDLKLYNDKLNLTQEVSFLGWVANQDLAEFYDSSDVLVVPSVFDRKGETEGMPVVILEAMALGLPVLASKISGIPDIVKDGYNGWLVEPKNNRKLAVKIKEIAGIDLVRYKDNALKTALNFSYDEIALNYKNTIEEYYD